LLSATWVGDERRTKACDAQITASSNARIDDTVRTTVQESSCKNLSWAITLRNWFLLETGFPLSCIQIKMVELFGKVSEEVQVVEAQELADPCFLQKEGSVVAYFCL